MTRRAWEDFLGVRSQKSEAVDVNPSDLVDMASLNHPSLIICLAYAQEELIYDEHNKIIKADIETYAATSRNGRVNKFGLSYRPDARFWLHKILANIVVGAAEHLNKSFGWRTVLYDGLRTVEGAFALYNFATDDDLAANLLAMPGKSAHNKGLAVDSMMVDENGCEIEMGGHFDHLDMSTNSRAYMGDKISETAKKNRIIREAAFLRSAFSQGLLIAPLRNEFWDDRLPENHEDLWRVLDSAARCIGLEYQLHNKEKWNYADFLANWEKIFTGHEKKLEDAIGHAMPPLIEKPEFYHGNYHPIYDSSLIESGKNQT